MAVYATAADFRAYVADLSPATFTAPDDATIERALVRAERDVESELTRYVGASTPGSTAW